MQYVNMVDSNVIFMNLMQMQSHAYEYIYIIATKNKCTHFKSKNHLHPFESFGDADFVDAYSNQTCEDPNSVKARSCWVIKYVGCPITQLSHLQSKIALSTREEECIALSSAAREVLLLREMIKELTLILNIPNT